MPTQIIRDTQVLNTKDFNQWDWDLIGYILKVHHEYTTLNAANFMA